MIETIDTGTRKTRKDHRCFNCGRVIPKGTVVQFGVFKYDDVYTLYHHQDCHAASEFYRKFHDLKYWDFDDGIPPLFEMISDAGEFQVDVDMLRGRFPHVACRLELSKQLAEAKR